MCSVPSSPPIGDVTGSLPVSLGLDNATYSDYQQALTYGTFIRFDLTISGTDVGNPNAVSGTDFSILLEDSTGMGLNTGTAGAAVDFYFPPLGGTQTVVISPPAMGNTPLVTLSPLSVPEPSSVLLMGLGIGAVVAVGRRRGKLRVGLIVRPASSPGRPGPGCAAPWPMAGHRPVARLEQASRPFRCSPMRMEGDPRGVGAVGGGCGSARLAPLQRPTRPPAATREGWRISGPGA